MRTLCCLGSLLLLASLAAAQEEILVGDRVVLVERELDLPIHDEPRGTDDFRRVAGGTQGEVLEIAGSWLRLEISADPGDDRDDWIHRRYVARVLDRDEPGAHVDPPIAVDDSDEERRVFSSLDGCRAVVEDEGRRMSRTVADGLRVGSWNIRWFPLGCAPGDNCQVLPTNVPWLACTIAWMDVDVLAVQEILGTDDGLTMLRELIDQLDALTGGAWHFDLQDCGSPDQQRVGFLWNQQRLVLEGHTDLWQLNGRAFAAADACINSLRPGRYARARIEEGADFQLVSVHLDAGRRETDWVTRRRATERLSELSLGGTLLAELDQDVLVLGDFNTMGGGDAQNSAADELELFNEEIAPWFRRLLGEPACTQFYQGEADLLDHVVAATDMRELEGAVRVTGYCAIENCQSLGDRRPAAYLTLSDHCPLVVELRNLDLDPPPVVVDIDPPSTEPTGDAALDEYYRDVDPSSAATLRRTLHSLIDDHRVFAYSHSSKTDTWDILEAADADPLDASRILDVYLNASYRAVGRGNDDYNREHTWPKSFGFPSRDDPPHTDCHHLFLSHMDYNRDRDRAIFDDCDASCFRFSTRAHADVGGEDGPFPDDDNWLLRRDNRSAVWQVWSERRGDVARAMLYMDVRYEGGVHSELNRREPDLVLLDDIDAGSASVRADGTVESRMGDLCTLLAWHDADPPDDRERRRNQVVQSFQGNRNPFIDRPQWAEVIFGSECTD